MESSGREQNYWPGFVDALSNVVLTLVFVLVVFVFALLIASNKVEKRAVEMVQAAHEEALKGENKDTIIRLEAELAQAKEELQKLRQQEVPPEETVLDKITPLSVNDATGLKAIGAVQISYTNGMIRIVFPKAISDMDTDSQAKLDQIFEEVKGKIINKKIFIRSILGEESYSAARRLAYYRVLGLRSHLSTVDFLKGAETTSQIVQPKVPGNGCVEIIFN